MQLTKTALWRVCPLKKLRPVSHELFLAFLHFNLEVSRKIVKKCTVEKATHRKAVA